ncbi:PREDICTED: protein NLRC3-like [Acropora digitifera]|uniref:protein NLRC3-like n=1 Tax=Acropora digitifera TaxID=70779 RepID=UPI00077A07EF|nr:PREDICTED: protein NLRC3-like [Acropora digitifera]
MPSRTEGFGLTGLEALSAGLPVLVSKNSGFGEALGSLPYGSLFVIDSEDPSTWTATIKGIWNRNRKSQLDEVKALYCSYGERYSWSEQCKHLIEKMFQLADGTSSEPEITAEAVKAKKRKLNEDFTDRSPRVPPKTKRGVIEKIESEQPGGTSSEPEIKPQAVGAKEVELNENFTGTSSALEITAQALAARELKLNEDFTGGASCSTEIIEGIRQVYQKCEGVILPIPWCDEYFQIEDIFTRLRLVAKGKTRRRATTRKITNMTSIFTPHECCKHPLIVLIEGEPGMGKTTYCQKLVFDWASKQCGEWDESFPRIDVLLLLRCRGIKSTIWDAIEEQILPDEIKAEEKEMFFQFLKENPSKVLLVLDGLDEADPQKLEMYLKLIQRKQLRGCYIVLTSRHEAGSKLRPYADTLLEIVGFTNTDAECYIRKYFQHAEHLAEGLISKVMFDKDLRELTQNPLNTLLLCVIFEDLEGILPTNRTELYVEIVLFILRRFESKNGLSNRDKDLLLVYKKELMILGETALNSLRKQELYFDDHKGDIKERLLIKFGFLSIQSGGSKRARCDRYGFFHKSFQEFFSGFFLAFSVIDDVTNSHAVLTDYKYISELFHALKFMTGIVAQRSRETAVSIMQSIASIVNETGGSSLKFVSCLSVANALIYECKNCSGDPSTLVRTLGESLQLVDVVVMASSFYLRDSKFIEPFFQALTFNSTISSLEIWYLKFSAGLTKLLAQALKVNTSLSSLNLRFNDIDDEGANSLAEALRVNTSLSSLDLRSNSIGDDGAISVAQTLRINACLSSLDLGYNSIGDEGANALAQGLRINTSLTSLKLTYNSIDDEGANSLAEALRVNTSLSSLDLDSNSISKEGTNSLAQALRVNTSLSSLKLSDNYSSTEGANSFAQSLRVNTSLSFLNLDSNDIGDEGVNSLAQALRVNTSLSSLNLRFNCIGDEGANSLAEALRLNTSLSSLDLDSNSICDEGANSVAQALEVNTSLSSLALPCSCIGDEGANSLAQALRVNTSLSFLNLHSNSISAEGASLLAQALKVNTSLSSLDLRSNSIGDEGANSLAQALRVNTCLSCLNLPSNSIGSEGANSLAQALRVNTSLSNLNLYSNSIGAEGANSLAQALRVNASLSFLALPDNSIGDEGASSLAQALRVNTCLSYLNLSSNSISNKGANSLAQALRVNTCLSSLNLSCNPIDKEGANSLSQALKVKPYHSFYLYCNFIDFEGGNALP